MIRKMTVGAVLAHKHQEVTKPKRYWLGPIGAKDDFGAPIKNTFIDGKTRQGPWAIMNEKSWKAHGYGVLGVGWGQKYEKQSDGRWLKIEG